MKSGDMEKSGVSRRSVLASGLVATAATAVAGVAQAKAPAIIKGLPDVVVVGAGAFGGWTALEMRERGAKVTLVDLYGPGNARASSGDESRLIRASYGNREMYSRMAIKSFGLWHKRQEEFGRNLIFVNGSLRELPAAEIAAQKPIFAALGLSYEMLNPDEIRHRWPQLNYDDVPQIFYEPRSGIVKARESMVAVSEAFTHKGGTILTGRVELGDIAARQMANAKVDGAPLSAGHYVFACGPWLPKVFPSLLGDRIRVPRREMFYVGSPAKDRRYRWEHCPNLTDHDTYTAADVDYGVKVAGKMPDQPMDPDTGDRMTSNYQADAVLRYVAKRMPGLAGQPIVASRVCQTEYSDNDHYMVDTHPDIDNVWIAGAGSGHAFKMGPALGEYVADRVTGVATDPAMAELFKLKNHGRATPANWRT